MKIKCDNDTIRRVISDGSCTKCWFNDGIPSCNPTLTNLCTTKNICYTFHSYKSDYSIFEI